MKFTVEWKVFSISVYPCSRKNLFFLT